MAVNLDYDKDSGIVGDEYYFTVTGYLYGDSGEYYYLAVEVFDYSYGSILTQGHNSDITNVITYTSTYYGYNPDYINIDMPWFKY